jgi:hypothetical protein
MIFFGCAAVALSALSAGLGAIFFGREMVPNLFAEISGVALEVALVILVVERVATYQRRRDARFAYQALSDRAAITFVDVMRLLWIRAAPVALAANGERHDEFRQIAELHLAEFRSNIEGFAGVLDPSSHETMRKIDRRLTWAISRLGGSPTRREALEELEDLARETAEMLELFLRRHGGHIFAGAMDDALTALRDSADAVSQESEEGKNRTFRWRLAAQTIYLDRSRRGRPAVRGILYDPDNELAFGYFSIDWAILVGEVRIRAGH